MLLRSVGLWSWSWRFFLRCHPSCHVLCFFMPPLFLLPQGQVFLFIFGFLFFFCGKCEKGNIFIVRSAERSAIDNPQQSAALCSINCGPKDQQVRALMIGFIFIKIGSFESLGSVRNVSVRVSIHRRNVKNAHIIFPPCYFFFVFGFCFWPLQNMVLFLNVSQFVTWLGPKRF